ncbi:MAG: site-specific DNA-methyltransferase [bacterium]|nr:site-specific DNA-methyltransferase [bacterium]
MKILREDRTLSYGTGDNLLVHGDNLEALRAILPFYAGQVKCIYIDPPYNTGSAFEHYDDNLEHSTWLNMMYPRLKLLREFLSEDGSIWISIDDAESHYLKVICDEICGRKNFVANVVWQKRYSRENREAIGDVHDHILVYAINSERFKQVRNKVPVSEEQAKIYKNPNNDPKGRWRAVPMTAQGWRPNQMYEIVSPSGKVFTPPPGRCWSILESNFKQLLAEGRIWFGKNGDSQPNTIRYLSEVEGFTPWTWWPSEETGHNDESKKEMLALFDKQNIFDTPKPERLIQRIIHIATNPGDLVLDSFLGSGTTAAVAHKMGRRWIGIEMGEHAKTHCAVRLRKVVDGEAGGVSKAVGWQGGGGFRYYDLGEAILKPDGTLTEDIPFETMAAHVWFTETERPYGRPARKSTVLGIHEGVAYALLYNGILGDRSVGGGNVLTKKTLKVIQEDLVAAGIGEVKKLVVYAEACRLSADTLAAEKIVFRQTPYDLVVRR